MFPSKILPPALCSGLALCLSLSGCGKAAAPTPAPTLAVTKNFSVEQHAQAVTFLQNYAEAIRESDAPSVNEAFDADALLKRVTYGLSLKKRAAVQFEKGFKQGLNNPNGGIAASFMGAYYELLPHTGTPESPQFICRKILDDGGLDYHRFEISFETGKPKIVDMYIFTAGEYLSQNFRRLILPMAAAMDKSIVKRLFNKSSTDTYLAGTNLLPAITQHALAFEYHEAYEKIQSLPAEMRQEKPIRIITLSVLASLKDRGQEYNAELESYRTAFPNDPSLDLVLIDYCFLAKDYPSAIAAIRALQKSVGGDRHLELLLASCYFEMDQGAKGLKHAKRYQAAFPDNLDGAFAVFQAYVLTEQFPQALVTLKTLRTDQEWEFDLRALTEDMPWMKPFAESREGKIYAEAE